MKEAMKEAAAALAKEGAEGWENGQEKEDGIVGCMIAYARALEMRQEGRKVRLEKACPEIGECIGQIQGPKSKAVVMEAIRNDLIERRKGIVLNELALLHQASDEEDDGLCDRRRNSVARQLRRLKPGAAPGLVALKKRTGLLPLIHKK